MMHRPICIPATPPGVTLFSVAVATHLLSGNSLKKATLQHLFGRSNTSIASCFSANVCVARSRGVLGEDITLLKQSGLFGLYASAMPPSRVALWLEALQRGSLSRPPNPQQFATGMAGQLMLKRVMHCCPLCVQEDQNKFGLAFWRTVHQIPGVLHCPVHHLALHGACLDCGRSQGSEHAWHLPATACPHCGSESFAKANGEMSPGYLRHLGLVACAVIGDYELLQPDIRARLYAEAFSVDQGGDTGQVIAALLDMWRCSNLAELSSTVGTRITWKFVDMAIRGDYDGVNPLGQLALISLAQSLIEARGNNFEPLNCHPNALNQGPLAGLKTALEASGLPLVFAEQLGAGHSITQLSVDSGIPYPRLRRQLVQIFTRDMNELHLACTDDVRSAEVRENLLALAKKLRRPRRKNNVFGQQRGVTGFEELRQLNRSKVQRYIEQGVSTRKQLHYKNSCLGDWCRAHDADWFDAVLPAIPQARRKRVGRPKGKLTPVPPDEAIHD